MPRFAANLGYLFTEHPLLERIDAAAAAGFNGIELQFPYDVPASDVKAAIDSNNLTVLGVSTPSGDRDKSEFGLAALPGREDDWEQSFATALDYITAIGGRAVHCLAGHVHPLSALTPSAPTSPISPGSPSTASRCWLSRSTHATDRAIFSTM